MICCHCGARTDARAYCPHCGEDNRIGIRTQYISNTLYNSGLELAKKRRLSEAIKKLRLSLRYFKRNTDARNLLGLLYYERGELYEALVEWNISLYLQRTDNIAQKYLASLQSSRQQIEDNAQFVRKYNQALHYIRQNDLDLASIQLQNILDAHPHTIRAAQLKALLDMKESRYDRAAETLEAALAADRSDSRTARYLEECRRYLKRDGSVKDRYNAHRDRRTLREMYRDFTDRMVVSSLLTLILGIVIGAAVLGFLVIPQMRQQQAQAASEALVEANETLTVRNHQISTLEDEISELEDELTAQKQKTKTAKQDAADTQETYEVILTAYQYYIDESYANAEDTLALLDTDALDEDLQETVTDLQTLIDEAQEAKAEAKAAAEAAEAEEEESEDTDSTEDTEDTEEDTEETEDGGDTE